MSTKDKRRMWLDDVRPPPFYRATDPNWSAIAKTYGEAIIWMEVNGCPDFISFDHDLGAGYGTDGIDIVHWMIQMDMEEDGKWIPDHFEYTVHSANPVGRANIVGLWESYLRHKRGLTPST